MRPGRRRPGRALLLVLAALATLTTGCGTAGAVTIIGPWTGAEGAAFREILEQFRRQTGIAYDYHGTRSLSAVLAVDVRGGTPPDVAVLPSPNELVNYQRQGALSDVAELADTLRRSYSPQWLQLAQAGTGRPYAVVVKATLKGMVWYNPAMLQGPAPATWSQLVRLTRTHAAEGRTPWCLGMGAMAASGFPGTDWIEDILLRRAGPRVYQRWAAGELPWTAPEVRAAWEAWGELVLAEGAVHGGRGGALLTDFTEANDTMFADPPGCFLEHQGSSVVSDYRKAGARLAFFPTPGPTAGTARAWEVSADLATMFRSTPQARELMRFLASDDAQRLWPRAEQGAVFTVNRAVSAAAQTDRVSRSVARILTTADVLCYDASDLMPPAMTNAFHRAVLGYLAEPGALEEILADLERVRLGVPPQDWAGFACGR
ncbi:ABC transporter substrate-binding protein [Prauserella muralis]|uniref:Uncharacterized protein n=1 Tax=Prauserella muralis TaxID=588067 RepID=A0A2V4AQG2_9PSEU|nr:extracellular solute-binding protein [Prauserella muralis]PXY22264.1 hypothetical protein BAY60_20510 [Prauserella muralis]TWE27904.1 alpha-glucoside transport system substrate-binding protein [Prauserella muralis]